MIVGLCNDFFSDLFCTVALEVVHGRQGDQMRVRRVANMYPQHCRIVASEYTNMYAH